jgi:DNA repair exonuclease SbcCD nuclease subunit
MIIFSDLHLKESNEEIVWRVLEEIDKAALEDPDKHVVFCGDFWQLRYQVSVRLLNKVNEVLKRWVDQAITVDLVPGNHDQVTVGGVNALEVLSQESVEVWTEPGIYRSVNAQWCGFVPYRKDPEDQEAALIAVVEALNTEGAEFPAIFGHFGVEGAVMNSGKTDREGRAVNVPGRILLVLGHYHKQQSLSLGGLSSGFYIGSPFQHTFGEAGNAVGYFSLVWKQSGWSANHIPLRIGPQHFIMRWDVAKNDSPPPLPQDFQKGFDKLRLDVVAPPSLINPDMVKTIKDAGLSDAQVNVQPVDEIRSHRFSMETGELLVDAAKRFVRERANAEIQEDSLGAVEGIEQLIGDLEEPLNRWAGVD